MKKFKEMENGQKAGIVAAIIGVLTLAAGAVGIALGRKRKDDDSCDNTDFDADYSEEGEVSEETEE